MTDTRDRSVWMVVLVDVVLAYAFSFVANGLIGGSEGPKAPPAYWLTQWFAYLFIAPIAAVAAWRGARQVLDAWAGRPAWWRLTVEGALLGAGCTVLLALSLGSLRDFAMALRDGVVLCGALGVVLTCANYPLARLLRPGQMSTRPGADASDLTLGAG